MITSTFVSDLNSMELILKEEVPSFSLLQQFILQFVYLDKKQACGLIKSTGLLPFINSF